MTATTNQPPNNREALLLPPLLLPPTLSTKETAKILGQSVATVERYASAGLIPTLTRRGTGAPWRIMTVRLLVDYLGLTEEQALAAVRFDIIDNAN